MRDFTRREALGLIGGVAAAGALSACGKVGGHSGHAAGPGDVPLVAASPNGTVQDISIVANRLDVDFAGRTGTTWAYGDSIPGKAIRAKVGDRMKITVKNDLDRQTSVHWHGLAIPNMMDGVPHVTMSEIEPATSFTYDFVLPDAGTYWFHPHTGLQLDTGLYAPFIIEDPNERVDYDLEWVVVLDDWTDGIDRSPEQIMADLKAGIGIQGMEVAGMDMGGMGGMHMDGGDVAYPLYLINGKAPADPDVLAAKPGQRVRVRMINASADTIYTVALGGHDLTVTHTDGFPIVPKAGKSLKIGMGERYDFTVTLGDGVFPLVAVPTGKDAIARALVRTGSGTAADETYRPKELDADPMTVVSFAVHPDYALPASDTIEAQTLMLTGTMRPYVWRLNGETYPNVPSLTAIAGKNARFDIVNQSMMSHPFHFHGHTFQLGAAGGKGARKDTVLIPPMVTATVELAAVNPGHWMVHCHNAYHAESGMMALLEYSA